MAHTSVGSRSQGTALVPSNAASSEFGFVYTYVRVLTAEEKRRADIIALYQNLRTEISEVYGAFNHIGQLIGAGAERELVVEAAESSGFKTQAWLI
jgi:hypothetical protein